MLEYKNLLVELEQGILWVTINRPKDRNALNSETIEELGKALDWAQNNDQTKIIVLEGSGHQSFVAGADIKQLYERDWLESLEPGMQGLYKKIESSTKATIAAVNGYALGGGFELALACDIRVASPNAKFGLPELNLGIIPGGGGTQRLARIVGKGKALEMILTGETINANEAKNLGLIKEIIGVETWRKSIFSLASKIMQKGPVAIRLAKLVVKQGFNQDMETALLIEKLAQTISFATEDRKEGAKAFIEKRKASFSNQ